MQDPAKAYEKRALDRSVAHLRFLFSDYRTSWFKYEVIEMYRRSVEEARCHRYDTAVPPPLTFLPPLHHPTAPSPSSSHCLHHPATPHTPRIILLGVLPFIATPVIRAAFGCLIAVIYCVLFREVSFL